MESGTSLSPLGAPDDNASDDDVETIREILSKASPFKVTVLSEHVSDRLTVALLQERGALV